MYDHTLDSEEMITCKYCGYREYPDVGMSSHICEGMREASKASNEAFERSWVGSGKRVRKRITIEFECYATEDAIDHVMNDIGYNWKNGGFSDDILEFKWRIV